MMEKMKLTEKESVKLVVDDQDDNPLGLSCVWKKN